MVAVRQCEAGSLVNPYCQGTDPDGSLPEPAVFIPGIYTFTDFQGARASYLANVRAELRIPAVTDD